MSVLPVTCYMSPGNSPNPTETWFPHLESRTENSCLHHGVVDGSIHGTCSLIDVSILRGKTSYLHFRCSESSGAYIITLKGQPTLTMHSFSAIFYTMCSTSITSLNCTTTCDQCCSVICLVLLLPVGQLQVPLSPALGLPHDTNSGQ